MHGRRFNRRKRREALPERRVRDWRTARQDGRLQPPRLIHRIMEVMACGRFVRIDVANRRHIECIRGNRSAVLPSRRDLRDSASLLHRREGHRQRKDVQGKQQDEKDDECSSHRAVVRQDKTSISAIHPAAFTQTCSNFMKTMSTRKFTCFGNGDGGGNPALVIEDGPVDNTQRAALAREHALTCVFIDPAGEPGVAQGEDGPRGRRGAGRRPGTQRAPTYACARTMSRLM
jgi:hypothetical protein